MHVGDQVEALVRFAEENFVDGEGAHVHAEPGEVGEIVDLCDGTLMVRWARSGTACDCDASQLRRCEVVAALA